MKRLIIHPKDKTTFFLSSIYRDWEETDVYTERLTSRELRHLFHHCPESTQILLLGHGCAKGLLYRDDETKDEFDLYVGHPHTHFLREHRNTIGIFCYAEMFASAERLHGLFSGMLITEMKEAVEHDVSSTEEEIERENIKFAMRVRQLLDEGCPLQEMPVRMRAMEDVHSPLTEFNYSNLFCL